MRTQIIGQTHLLSQIDSLDKKNFPHTFLIDGKQGNGKHTILKYIGSHLNITPVEITEQLTGDFIMELYIKATPFLYFVNLDNITEKEQNLLLKVTEDFLPNVYIGLLCSNSNNLLVTLKSRCCVLTLEPYDDTELKMFLSSDFKEEEKNDIIKITQNPSQLINCSIDNMKNTQALCIKLIEKVGSTNYANLLLISSKMNYKDEFDKIDVGMFFDVLLKNILFKYKEEPKEIYLKYYSLTSDFKKRLIDSRLNKQLLIENYLTRLWKVSREKI